MIERPSPLIELLLIPLAWLYSFVMRLRNIIFDSGWRGVEKVSVPVVSIGNLTAGGTGKTPLVALLIEAFEKRGRRVGVVSRGYGGTDPGPARVSSNGAAEDARRFGDEPTWLAARFPAVPVVIGRDRAAAARRLCGENKVDFLLADDAFQHRRLHRDFDIVIIDATEPSWHYRALPLGRMREQFASLKRADAVFLTKTNLVDVQDFQLHWLRDKIVSSVDSKKNVVVVNLESRITGLARLEAAAVESEARTPADCQGRKAFLVSAIGRPQTFALLVAQDLGMKIEQHAIYPDHHSFTADDANQIFGEFSASGADDLIMTEKDAVKLSGLLAPLLQESGDSAWVSRLETRPKTDMREFYAAIDRLFV